MNKIEFFSLLIRLSLLSILLITLFFSPGSDVFAFQVDPLPENNLVINPWFRDQSDSTRAGLDGWTDAAGRDPHWGLSQKSTNPSPDEFISGKCGNVPDYCGTSARLHPDTGIPLGVDAYLYQVIAADPANRRLHYFAHWVAHAVGIAEVTIYGGVTADGPWTEIWKPFHQEIDTVLVPPRGEDQDWLWKEMTSWTPPVETVIPRGHPYYKLEIHARLVDEVATGFKITGIYFTTVPDIQPTPTPTATQTPTPFERETTPTETPTPTPTQTTRTRS